MNQALSYSVKIDKETTSVSINVQCLVQVFAVVNFFDEVDDDVGDAINFFLLAHEVDLIVESLGHLEDGMNQEAITKFFRRCAVETKHLLTKLLLHVLREVVKES